jgi:hypothetical protein
MALGACALSLVLLTYSGHADATDLPPPSAVPGSPASQSAPDELQEIVIQAPEPRYVAPTFRDRIGRIWAPVYLNGHGPFRLVLDSGATRSGITAAVADALQLPPDQSHLVLLRGVTGSATVPTVKVNSFEVGDITFGPAELPILADAFGGAQGILGTDHFVDRRITVQFRHDQIEIARSHGERAPSGFITVPFQVARGNLLSVDATIGGVRVKAIIDTGGQVTIANLALRAALGRYRSTAKDHEQAIMGVTDDVQEANNSSSPPLRINGLESNRSIEINFKEVNYGDMKIFDHWHLTNEPAILIGMDVLGTLDVLIIDYRRHELQIRALNNH